MWSLWTWAATSSLVETVGTFAWGRTGRCVRACVRSRAGSTSDCAQVLHALQAACQASGATLLLVVVAPGADGESSAAQLVRALFTASLLSHCLLAESLPPC